MTRFATPAVHPSQRFLSESSLLRALDEVTTPDGIQASSRESFKGAIFGRDSLEVGLDVVDHLPEMARRILFSVARHIGVETNEITEEEPGKGLHEYRNLVIGGEVVGNEQRDLLLKLSEMWGGNGKSVTYFGAADTSGLFLDLLARYVRSNGTDILDRQFMHARTESLMSIEDAAVSSADWYVRKVSESSLDLVEFHRTNPRGHWYQVMRDGHDGMADDSNNQANPHAPIAAIEIQAVAYSGLMSASELFPANANASTWRTTAQQLRDRTIELLWSEDEQYFYRAIYRDPQSGAPRALRSIDTAPAELLRAGFFDQLADDSRSKFVSAIVRRIFSEEFVTPVGPRTLSNRHSGIFGYSSYQGPNTVWPTIVKRIADGLHHYGFGSLGLDLDARLIECCERYGDFPEYVFVFEDGTPVYRTTEKGRRIVSPARPMTVQAWTASAAYGAFKRNPVTEASGSWQEALSKDICNTLWDAHTAFLDHQAGEVAEHAFIERMGHGSPALGSGWSGQP